MSDYNVRNLRPIAFFEAAVAYKDGPAHRRIVAKAGVGWYELVGGSLVPLDPNITEVVENALEGPIDG